MPNRDSFNEDLAKAEWGVILQGMREILVGTEHQQGLIWVSAEQSKQVEKINYIVQSLATDINGADGIRSDIKDIKKELLRMQKTEERLERLEKSNDRVTVLERETASINSQLAKIDEKFRQGPVPEWVYGAVGVAISLIALFFSKGGH